MYSSFIAPGPVPFSPPISPPRSQPRPPSSLTQKPLEGELSQLPLPRGETDAMKCGAGLRTRRGKWVEKRGGARRNKRGVPTRFSRLSSFRLLLLRSSGCVDFRLVSSSLGGGSSLSSLLLSPVAVDGEEGRARCRDEQPAVPRLCRRDGAPAFLPRPRPNERARDTCRHEARARGPGGRNSRSGQRGTTCHREVATLFLFIGFCVNACGRRLWD